MNHKIVLTAIAMFAVSMIFAGATIPTQATGNGAPSGPHYNLNLIGKDKTDILPDDSNNGHRIFVNLFADGVAKKNKIYLTEGDFGVIDADATDGRAEFMLPNPFNDDGSRSYYVYVRELGKPGGSGSLTTCYTDVLGDDYCLLGELTVPLNRSTGKSTFRDVTTELTTLCFDSDPDPAITTVVCESIFSDALKDYYWNYNNDGLKIIQLRFYPTA
jgi:hypothetical protein